MSQNIFPNRVKQELEFARLKHNKINSLHEGYAVILEELEEFWNEIKKKDCDQAKVYDEVVQIGAMAQRIAEDCILNIE